MPELRKDPVTGRWVIISTERQKRPSDFRFERPAIRGREHCPFCPGREAQTPPELLAYRQNGGAPNSGDWLVRVVPNKFPALQVDGRLDPESDGTFERMNGIGAHEVIIETPDHDKTFASMSEPEIGRVLSAFRERVLDLKQDHRLRYILVFKNQGATAGATLEHAHSQLIALPVVPDFVREEIEGVRRHFAAKKRCVFCDIVHHELAAGVRVIQESGDFVGLAPYAPRLPFEAWVLPRRHASRFEDAAEQEYQGLAGLLKAVLTRMDRALESPAYNLIVHSAPFNEAHDGAGDIYHWHIEILPKLARTAGFEWGTGFYINPTSPEEAARLLRAVST
jgi:UDPglucose--hexose-1-phosphate uridylyltransferase